MNTFRLRSGKQIVGYERVEGKSKFYSKDYFWWNGKPIEYSIKDKFSELKDKNNRPLFEHDIILLRFKNPLRKDRKMRLSALKETFELIDIDSGKKEDLKLISKTRSIEFLSFTFINVDFIFRISKG